MTLLSAIRGDVKPEERIFSLVFEEDEISWQSMIYELVRSEQMDPWDIDVGVIAERFVDLLNKMKEFDFRISGKMVLAAAILVKMKSERLLNEDLSVLDNLINNTDPEEFLEELEEIQERIRESAPPLRPRTPQPRERKVSVYDLVDALEKALRTESYKVLRKNVKAPEVKPPEKKADMNELISKVFSNVKKVFSRKKKILFDDILLGDSREDVVLTLIPLLHLDTQRKIDLEQKEHFGPIFINLRKADLD